MFEEQQKKIEIPPSVKPAANEPQIFSMPEKFRGLAGKVAPPVMKPATLPPPATLAQTPRPLVPPPPKPPALHHKNHNRRTIIIAAVALIAVLVSSGVYIYFSFKPVTKITTTPTNNTAVVNKPATNQARPDTGSSTNSDSNQAVSEQPTTLVSPFPNNSQPGRDTDSDGLTDVEEILYKTSAKKPDTDSDGFLDGNEVFHGYDPNAPSPATLIDSGIVAIYSSQEPYAFHFDYPAAWLLKIDPKKTGDLILTVPSGEIFSLSFEEKTVETDLTSWFSGVNPSTKTTVLLEKTKSGLEMLVTEDKMTVYIEGGSWVLVFSYQNTIKATVDYLMTFEMMINSLFLGPDYVDR
jgi:hypothetical protein